MTQRYKISMAYDGTEYAGWQLQLGQPTVQEMLEKALGRMAGHAVRAHSSSRTDAGVHARGMAVHFDLPLDIPPRAVLRALNGMLPSDIRVNRAEKTGPDFHARFDAVGKEYRYFIYNGEILPPFLRHYRMHCRRPLALERMAVAAQYLEGTHDFSAFTANTGAVLEDPVREISQLELKKRGAELMIRVYGPGFLYKMVRSLAGFLIRVGKGELEPEDAERILRSRVRTAEVPSAQAQGLFLWRVFYG